MIVKLQPASFLLTTLVIVWFIESSPESTPFAPYVTEDW